MQCIHHRCPVHRLDLCKKELLLHLVYKHSISALWCIRYQLQQLGDLRRMLQAQQNILKQYRSYRRGNNQILPRKVALETPQAVPPTHAGDTFQSALVVHRHIARRLNFMGQTESTREVRCGLVPTHFPRSFCGTAFGIMNKARASGSRSTVPSAEFQCKIGSRATFLA